MAELIHSRADCTAWSLCLGGPGGLFCGNCGTGQRLDRDALEAAALEAVSATNYYDLADNIDADGDETKEEDI